jgi:CheY-like chemotaxis protein
MIIKNIHSISVKNLMNLSNHSDNKKSFSTVKTIDSVQQQQQQQVQHSHEDQNNIKNTIQSTLPSSVTFTIPVSGPVTNNNTYINTYNVSKSSSDKYKHKKNKCISLMVLIVDDSRATRRMVSRMLHSKGCICDEAEDGLMAVSMAREKKYDLILMDFIMPNMNGVEASRMIRDQGYQGLIFGLTGNGLSQDVTKFLEHGADRVFIKPLDMKRFLRAIEGVYIISHI